MCNYSTVEGIFILLKNYKELSWFSVIRCNLNVPIPLDQKYKMLNYFKN